MPLEFGLEERLKERIKELTCLYQVSSILRAFHGDQKQVFQAICEVMKEAWKHPEKAVVELKTAQEHIHAISTTSNFVFQSSPLVVMENEVGFIRVAYPKNQLKASDFLEEEQKLLEKVSFEISNFLEREARKEKEELLKRSAERNDRLSILGEITAGIAHELNTPLGNILGFAELIVNETSQTHQFPSSVQPLVKNIENDAQKIIKSAVFSREVVKKLMFFACEMPQQAKEIEIYPVVEQALTLLGQRFKQAKVSYDLKCASKNIKAKVDPIQFSQVIFNLLINALYASPENSNIEISLSEEVSEAQQKQLVLQVKDEGEGISEELKPKIFQPFFSTKPAGESTGLGLSVVHGIVKAHQGEITCEDNHPKGTIFTLKFPNFEE
ncbi:MAG: GHKL domain-containing protein [Flavobacteriaceae bacterium]|nr:GHKL domain-containing protein [Flavobacteriaceae bacterium]